MKALFLTILLSFVAASIPVRADYIFRSDGSILEAKIITQTATSVTITNAKGKKETIRGIDIIRIREKPYIRKNVRIFDIERGRVFFAFIVDETPTHSVLRLELGSPDEIRVRRDRILELDSPLPFVPEAIPGSRDITLQWDVVPDAVNYLVCSVSAGRYMPLAESSKPSVLLKDLKGNTSYNLAVFASDGKGGGKGPSKSVQCVTLNNPPEAPKPKLSFSGGDIVLSWNRPGDEDGSVKEYAVYEKTGGAFIEIARTPEERFSLKGDASTVREFAVSAVDDKTGMSAKSVPVKTRENRTWYYKAEFIYAYPYGGMSDDFNYGMGAFLTGERKNVFLPDLSLGLDLGAIHFTGDSGQKGDLFAACADVRYGYAPSAGTLVSGSFAAGPGYFGGKGKTRDFSRRGSAFFFKGGIERRISAVAVSGNVLWGNFYSRNMYRYFFGASLSVGTAVDF
jgi:hypothetical protein